MLCSNNISNLHLFGDIATFTVYVSACNLGNGFSVDNTVEIAYIHTYMHIFIERQKSDNESEALAQGD